MSDEIFLDAPDLGEREKEFLCQAVDSGYVSTVGPFVPRFEALFAAYHGTEKAVAVQSGTAALHIALIELGIGPDDEVIIPALTFIATANPVRYVGATPVFVDVEPETWTLDVVKVGRAVTEKTKAIIPVHLYGVPCDMEGLQAIALKHGLFLIEDATESLGATFKGKHTGCFGEFGCYSFNGNKTITTGGGGMILGRDTARLGHIKYLVNQARSESQDYYHPEIGYNYRMTALEAALGLAQMERLDEFLALKRSFNAIYSEELSGIDGLRLQYTGRGSEASFWLTCVTIERENLSIEDLQKALMARGVPTRRVFRPIPDSPPYHQFQGSGFPISKRIYDRGLCLPSSTRNRVEDIARTCKVLREVLSQCRSKVWTRHGPS